MTTSPRFLRLIPRIDANQRIAWRYGGAIVASLAFIGLRWLIAAVFVDDGFPFAILSLPVALSAFYGGLGPGLVSVLITVGLTDYLLVPPLYTLGLPGPKSVLGTMLFAISGLVISALGEIGRNAVLQASSGAEINRIAQHQLLANEERLRITEQVVSGGVWDWDVPNDTVYWSDGFQRLHDFPLDQKPSRATWVASLHPDDRDRVVKELEELFVRRLHHWAMEYRIRTASRRTRWISSNGRAFYDPAGNPLRLVGINLDISARRFAEGVAREAEPRAHTG
jgi:PAS domain-containing protein